MAKITVDVSPDGAVEIHVMGVKGKKCEDIENAVAKLLGIIKKSERTGEFYEQPVVEVTRVGR